MCSSFKSENQILMGARVYRLMRARLCSLPWPRSSGKVRAMKLYTYYRSTAAFRVRIALNIKGVPYESISLHLRSGEHQTHEYTAAQSAGADSGTR